MTGGDGMSNLSQHTEDQGKARWEIEKCCKGDRKGSLPVEEAGVWFTFDGGADKKRVRPPSGHHLIRTPLQRADISLYF